MSSALRSRLLLLTALLLGSRGAEGSDVVGGFSVARALARAVEKVESPACLAVLRDFRDAEGRALEVNLAATGLSAPAYLGALEFRSGRAEDTCQRSRIDAFTRVGASTIWICPGGSLAFGSPRSIEGPNTLIHEMLHTLGLAEYPPTPREITEQVRSRCGP